MELRQSETRRHARSQPANVCAQCGAPIPLPQWSEPIDENRVKHLWECAACDYTFETLVCFARN